MSLSPSNCPKCNGSMVKGFLPVPESTVVPTYWVEGQLEKNFFGSVKTQDRDIYRVFAYRCRSCGFMEVYAQETPER